MPHGLERFRVEAHPQTLNYAGVLNPAGRVYFHEDHDIPLKRRPSRLLGIFRFRALGDGRPMK
jgi:hypothetical protein